MIPHKAVFTPARVLHLIARITTSYSSRSYQSQSSAFVHSTTPYPYTHEPKYKHGRWVREPKVLAKQGREGTTAAPAATPEHGLEKLDSDRPQHCAGYLGRDLR